MPPAVTKQSPRPTTTPPRTQTPRSSGGILGRAVPVDQAVDPWVHMLLYGRNRVGKTTLACQWPKPLLLVSLEPTRTGGSRSVAKVKGVTNLWWGEHLTTVSDVERLGHELREDDGYRTVVLDSGSSLEELVLAEVCGWQETANILAFGPYKPGAKVSQDQYVERSERMRKVLRPYLGLAKHVLVLANEKDHNPPESRKSTLVKGLQTESFFAAAMGGGTTRWVQDGCDYVCQLYIDKETTVKEVKAGGMVKQVEEETGRFVRRLRTSFHPNYAAGFRSPTPEAVPEYLEDPTTQGMYQKFMAVAGGA